MSHRFTLQLLLVPPWFSFVKTRFQVTIQILVGVELGRVGGQVKHLDFFLVLHQPGFGYLGMVNPQIVLNQKDFSVGVLGQTLHEIDQNISVHATLEESESDFTPVGDRRDQVDGLAPCVQLNDRRLAFRYVAAGMLAVIAQSRLITPVNLSVFCLCASMKIGIFIVQPALKLGRSLLLGLLVRLLNRKTPALRYSPSERIGSIRPVSCLINCCTAWCVQRAY